MSHGAPFVQHLFITPTKVKIFRDVYKYVNPTKGKIFCDVYTYITPTKGKILCGVCKYITPTKGSILYDVYKYRKAPKGTIFCDVYKSIVKTHPKLSNLRNCLESNQFIDYDRRNKKNCHPHHDLPQTFWRSKSVYMVWHRAH